MENKFEYNFGSKETQKNVLPEKISPEFNEYLLPINTEMWDIIVESLEDYKDSTKISERKVLINEFFKSIEKLDSEDLLGKIAGYYLVTDYKNFKWKEPKKIRLEIKIQKEEK